jgi:hypothetical protein
MWHAKEILVAKINLRSNQEVCLNKPIMNNFTIKVFQQFSKDNRNTKAMI